MALQVWLPLVKDGDFFNKGIANIEIINNNATFSANKGKIGSCYSFNGSSNYLYTSYNFYNSTYSISAWIYTTSSSATQTIICDRTTVGYGFSIFLIGGKLRIDPGGTSVQWTTNYTYPINTWWNLIITYNGTKVAYYINGEFQQEYATTLTQSYWGNIVSIGASQAQGTNYSNYLNGRLNDIRIYDHALSIKEIKEISKALTIHFKIDDISHDNDSIVYDSSGYGNNGVATRNQMKYNVNTPRHSKSNIGVGSYTFCRINGNATYNNGNNWMSQGGTEMTVSEWAYSTDWTNSNSSQARLWSCTQSGGFNTEAGSTGYLKGIIHVYTNSGQTSSDYKYSNTPWQLTNLTSGWHMFTMVYQLSGITYYLDGEEVDSLSSTSYGLHFNLTGSSLNLGCEANAIAGATSPWFSGGLSDFRLYYTALSAEDIKELYEVSASIDDKQNFYAYEFVENTSNQELLVEWNSNAHNAHVNTGKWASYNNNGEWYLYGYSSFGTPYIPVSPTGKTYYYDMTLSVSAGNQAYVGICRFDANKGSASNEGCIYIYSTKPTSDIVKQRFFGTVNLGTTANGLNPLAYITLRVLNGWSGSTNAANAEMTIHNISLREVDTATGITTASIIKTGVISSDSIREYDGNARIIKNGFIEANELIEI